MNQDVSDSIKKTKVDRAEFSAAMAKLLKAPPTSKEEISNKLSGDRRSSRQTKPLRDSQ
jgi:hypothetical protein